MQFSNEQKLAIEAPLEPGLIVAGAGTGKTSVMVERVSYLVKEFKIQPEEILGLTFTNKAAGEFKERTLRRLKENKLHNIAIDISTYHSFAHNLVINHGLRIGIDGNAQILSDSSRAQFAYRVVKNTDFTLPNTSDALSTVIKRVLKLDSELAEHDIEIDELINKSEIYIAEAVAAGGTADVRKMIEVAKTRLDIAELVREFRAAKASAGVIDFADQLRYALQIVKEHSQVVDSLRETYRAVLLDEYQDTSITQRLLMMQVFGSGHPVTAVGDRFQAIYGWRGAAVSNIEQYQYHFSKADGSTANIYYLTTNYRSGNNILKVANEISDPLHAPGDEVQKLSAVQTREDQGQITLGLYETSQEEIKRIVEQIKGLAKTTSISNIAILARTNTVLQKIYHALQENLIPATYVGTRELLKVPEINELVAYLKIIEDPTHNPSLIKILTGPRFQVSLRDIKLLADRARILRTSTLRSKNNTDIDSLLSEAVSGFDVAELSVLSEAMEDPGELDYGLGVKEVFNKLSSELNNLRRNQTEFLTDFIYRVLRQTNLLIEIQVAQSTKNNSKVRIIEEFIFLANHFAKNNESVDLGSFLDWLLISEDIDQAVKYRALPERDAVTLITIHSAKGLEWPIVFLPEIVNGSFPNKRADLWVKKPELLPYWIRQDAGTLKQLANFTSKTFKEYEDELKQSHLIEERRLMYVAITRAKDQIFISGHNWGVDQKTIKGPSLFLEEIKEVVRPGLGQIDHWQAVSLETTNPNLKTPIQYRWPQSLLPERQNQLAAAAELVKNTNLDQIHTLNLTNQELAVLEKWDQAYEYLLSEIAENTNPVKQVRVPANLNVTRTIEITKNRERVALDLLRPMPKRPFIETKRGTQFHLWIENYYQHPTLLDPFDLPGEAAIDELTDEELSQMQENFLASAWAKMKPIALEWDFDLKIANRYVRGRIDAVFKDKNSILIVDWKTGKKENSDPLQLALYRIAWAARHKVSVENIEAAFVYLPSLEKVQPADLPLLAEIESLITNA